MIHELVARRGFTDGAGLRIAAAEEPGQGFTVGVAAAPEAEDEIVPIEDLGVFLEPRAAEALEGKTLDAGVGPEGEVAFSVVDESWK